MTFDQVVCFKADAVKRLGSLVTAHNILAWFIQPSLDASCRYSEKSAHEKRLRGRNLKIRMAEAETCGNKIDQNRKRAI